MSYLKKIIHNCKQATYLIEKKSIKRLTLREAIELRIHLFGCSFCRIFQKQSHIINNLVKELFKSAMPPNSGLDDTFKKELQEKIEEELNK
ncbi:hypothetical protein [Mucilaginibacter sp.]|uniref:hypothetical protein n=1 Tax=Mucilaginibacter sp. TaxID=1882438 RepID=UPI002847F45F|nr:hypothetical protein [Mucilaginibacter sp.]MDR3696567.1 hypothetical protein [Mucilaginibacter sp.]